VVVQALQDTEVHVRSSYERSLEPGETIFDEGDAGERLYVISAGEVEISREEGGARRVVARLGPGDFFGELSALQGGARTARAVAVARTRVLELDGPTLEAMCLEQPEIAIRMIRGLVARLTEAERRLAALGVDDLLRPVVRTLLRRAEPRPGAGGVRIPATLRSLAEESGLSLREAHRALQRLFDRRILDLVDDCLVARDLETLSASIDAAE
jgi:CRP-like cAMP-binding protein